jgi:Protein of unknown function (DUF1688)
MSVIMHIHFAGTELMTGLPEYRNGGLFIDTGVLTLKPEAAARGLKRFTEEAESGSGRGIEVVPMFEASDDVVVEWRAVTVGLLDDLLRDVNRMLGLTGGDELSLPQMLEAGSWKVRIFYLALLLPPRSHYPCRSCGDYTEQGSCIGMRLTFTQGGREIAEVSRPNTKEPPIMIISDGTVF